MNDGPPLKENLRLRQKVDEHVLEGIQVAGLDGPALNAMDVADLCLEAGWTDPIELAKALATFCSESLYHTRAFHHNLVDGKVDSTDWGPCQINDKTHPDVFPGGDPDVIACNPMKCFRAARSIYVHAGDSFDPWFGWKNGVALDDYYLRRAALGIANYVAREFVHKALGRAPVIADRNTPETLTRIPMVTLSEFRRIYPPHS